MNARRLRREDLWIPRAADLPPEGDVRAWPGLAGIENNPVFRRRLQRARRPLPVTLQQVLVFAVLAASMALIMGGTFSGFRNLAGQALLWFGLLGVPRLFRKRRETLVAGISIQEWSDLADAGFSPHDAAHGLWAVTASRRARDLGIAGGIAMWVLMGALFVIFPARGPGGSAPFLSAFLAMGCVFLPLHGFWRLGNRLIPLENARARLLMEGRTALGAFPAGSQMRAASISQVGWGLVVLLMMVAMLVTTSAGPRSSLLLPAAILSALLGWRARRRSAEGTARRLEEFANEVRIVMEHANRAIRPADFA